MSGAIEPTGPKHAIGILSARTALQPLKRVKGPDGAPLMLCDLPPAHTTRWVARRKAEVVCAVRGGLIGVEEVCRRYVMTIEEYLGWERAFDRFGVPGLHSVARPAETARAASNPTRDGTISAGVELSAE